jgi:hypothetical protein
MYIPIWLIIFIFVLWLFTRSNKSGQTTFSNSRKKILSYKLDIQIEPSWYEIYKKASGKNGKELNDYIDSKLKEIENLEYDDGSLWGKRYFFTEYYDASSGLITKFQRVVKGEKQVCFPVSEFGDSGYIFNSDSGLGNLGKETEHQRENRKKLSVEIGESYIRNDIYDKYIGGAKSESDYLEENYLFKFPLHDMFEFFYSLGARFDGAEESVVIKWPDHIEAKFKELGIKYEKQFEFEPTQFNIEEHDRELYEKLGRPKISMGNSGRFHSSYLSCNNTYFGLDLKIFRPSENDRIGY